MATAKKKPAAKKAAPKAPRQSNVERNGIVKPNDGTNSGKIWDIADSLSSKGNPASRGDVIAAAGKKNINEATVATQYQRWRVFHGIVTRSPGSGRKAATAKKAPAKKAAAKGKPAAKKAAPKKPAAKKSAPRKRAAPAAPEAPAAQ